MIIMHREHLNQDKYFSVAKTCAVSKAAYDVFLSHRGPDTKKSFAVWLLNELENQQIRTFFDDRSLKAGDNAALSMDAAMQTVEWGVIILSPGFFASGHCMNELKAFLDRGRAILIGFDLGVNDCIAEKIVTGAPGSVWEEHGGRLWERCCESGTAWSEEEWRDVVGKVRKTTVLELPKDGYWDKCLAEAVSIVAQKLGRPVLARNSGAVNTTPFPPNSSFLGRDAELEEMSKQLAESFGRVCITGMGGMGKTQLALAFVYKHQREYGKILWLDADAQSLRTCYLGLAIHLGIQTNVEEGGHGPGTVVRKEEDLVERIRDALESAKIPCLLVLDNVDDQEQMAELLPRRGPCHIVVTTRLRAVGNFGLVHIDKLGREDGLQLLRRGLQFSAKEDQCLEQLAERFGFLTLALAVSSRLILEGRLSPSELLRRLDLKGVLVFERELVDPTFKKHPDLVKLLQTSFDMLARDTRANEEEKRLAKAITAVGGWFARGSISTNLLARAASNLVGTTVHLEGDRIEDDFEQFEDSVGLLCFYALATKTTDERVVFHALVQEFGKWSGGDRAGHAMLQAVCDIGLVEQDEEHFENAAEKAIPPDSGATADLALTLKDGQRVVQAIGLKLSSYYITARFRPEAALDLVKRCDHVLQVLGVPKDALSHFEVLNTKALVLEALGRYTEAEHFFRDALEYLEKKVGPAQLQTATCLNHLASSLESQGKYCIAEPLYRRALGIREKQLGHTHKSTVASITSLAGVLQSRGKYAEAEALYKRALKVHEETLGAANPETATSLSNLACLLEFEGKFDEAETLFRQALEVREAQLGPSHPLTAASLHQLAGLLGMKHEYDEAEPLLRRAVEVRQKVLGPRHPHTGKI